MKLLSIIIPLYKVEEYIERCIRSLEDQDLPREAYEIICVNDGSPDNCRKIVENLQLEFQNIVLINQTNHGVSYARNTGINRSTGRYLLMVDPDDFVMSRSLRRKLDLLESNDLDFAYTGYYVLNENLEERYCFDPKHGYEESLSGVDFYFKYQRGYHEIDDPHRSWAIFFKASFLEAHDLRYLVDVPYLEDGEFMARAVCLAQKVSFLNEPFYLRTIRRGSATNSRLYYSDRARDGFIKAAFNLLTFRNEYCNTSCQRVFMNYPIFHFVIIYITSLKIPDYVIGYRRLYRTLKKGPFARLDTQGCSDLYKKMGGYYNHSIHFFYSFWILHNTWKSIRIRFNHLIHKPDNYEGRRLSPER